MTARGELAGIIRDSYLHPQAGENARDSWRAADRLLAAGYRKPRTIPDEHFLHSDNGDCPVEFTEGTIVESADGSVWRFGEYGWESLGWGSAALNGPATVLYEASR